VARVALATCERFPDLDAEDRLLLPALERLDITAVPAVWSDPDVDWSSFDMVVLRGTWDYSTRHDEFLAWARMVADTTVLLNPVDVVAWNTDKHYLQEIAAAGMAVVPTTFVEPGDDVSDWRPPEHCAEFVIKPAVSAGSQDTCRYLNALSLAAPREHLRRLLESGKSVMIQPYLEAVDSVGETAVVFLGGEYSHAIRKGPLLVRDIEGDRVEGLFVQEQIDAREVSSTELVEARSIVECIPGGFDRLLYARVDLIPDEFGVPRLLELELCEPSLFLSHSDGAPERLAEAIRKRLAAA
jgi:glutathione synthase/RimK-type ligase-like ATP-grasp enzyme